MPQVAKNGEKKKKKRIVYAKFTEAELSLRDAVWLVQGYPASGTQGQHPKKVLSPQYLSLLCHMLRAPFAKKKKLCYNMLVVEQQP